MRDQFAIIGVADPSAAVTEAVSAQYGPLSSYSRWEDLLAHEALDAIVVCSPHATHAGVIDVALANGLHVFVEKPLCIDPADGERIAVAARAAGLVVQVGYMKRYAPAFGAFLDALPSSAEQLRAIDVLTYDPWMAREPFLPWWRIVAGNDIPSAELARFARDEAEQVGRAVGDDDPETVRAYSYTYLACLVHDVNLVHGALDRLGVAGDPEHGASWAGGDAASATLKLPNGARWQTTWLLLPGLMTFEERARFFFADAIHELTFPVPYHVDAPVEHRITTAAGGAHRQQLDHLVSDPYRDELVSFHASVTDGAECPTPPVQATRDIEVLRTLFLRS
jgi:predicted dehydrogenase